MALEKGSAIRIKIPDTCRYFTRHVRMYRDRLELTYTGSALFFTRGAHAHGSVRWTSFEEKLILCQS